MSSLVKQSIKNLPYLRGVFTDRDHLRADRDHLLANCEHLRANCDDLRAERDRAMAERDQLRIERDRTTAELERMRGSFEEASRARVVKPIMPALATVQPHEQDLLRRVVHETNTSNGPIIEIGTLLGVTTTKIALWKSVERKIITVDNYAWNPWGLTPTEHRDITHQMLYYLIQAGNVEQVVMDKNVFFRWYQGEAPSLVFLDAIHTYEETKIDIEWAKSIGAGMICGHDYCEQFPGVMQAVDEAGAARHLAGSVFCL